MLIKAVVKELILPEFGELKKQVAEIDSRLELTNKRLDDINIHLADQSRRIDAVREELSKRIDETNKRIDSVREELTQRIDCMREELIQRIDGINDRINRLYEVIVRREEHFKLEYKVNDLEQRLVMIERKLAA